MSGGHSQFLERPAKDGRAGQRTKDGRSREVKKVMIMAGGTGGHIFPGLAVAEALRARGHEVVWLGSVHGPENRWVPAARLPLETLAVTGLRGRGVAGWLAAPLRLWRALREALEVFDRHRPDAALSMGGFAAGPGGVAAWRRRIPLLVHEQNAVAGLTSRLLARLADRVLAGLPGVLPGAEVVGNPVRRDIAALPLPAERFAGRSGKARLLVIGGSQGAKRLNELVPLALASLAPEARPEVRHQCGERHLAAARSAYAQAGVEGVHVTPFIDDMAGAYAWADLVVARAGALTLAELAAAGVGALLIPFPFAVDDHQAVNAAYFVEAGAAEMHREQELDAGILARRLEALLGDRPTLLAMAEAARGLACADAAERLADACLET